MNKKKRRPWIKVLDQDGKVIKLCKDPNKATLYFVHYVSNDGSSEWFINSNGYGLKLDNQEYNPPIMRVITPASPLYDNSKTEHTRAIIREKLKYLIDLHKSFYY